MVTGVTGSAIVPTSPRCATRTRGSVNSQSAMLDGLESAVTCVSSVLLIGLVRELMDCVRFLSKKPNMKEQLVK